MYYNIGEKLNFLAKICFWIVVIAAIIAGVALTIVGGPAESLLLVLVGSLVAWLTACPLYAFGEIVDELSDI